ncbi:NAD(P)/FAD-dependent oxidoreductase [Acinetobacter sp. ANC 4173]|uniref:NAD(P)/FAD-dependent oxidoreductase n=1 Tax=Acinetobacter sp. ANC 4173 TaxID=2529837 RepID=UPI00103AD1A0|nr:FAD-dependent oxidoreductase [Acinetobacter sp. ANC 4173]TCB82383.1 FAD-dependent oxidoreductase [Acinetobacter sp. ANC 4173]
MNIVIIGAGISGLLSALELAEQGCQVNIYNQTYAGQASWAGGGILSPMYPWRYPRAVNLLAQHGKAMYQTWNEKLQPVTGIDFEIHETGMLILDETDFEVGLNYKTQFQDPMQHCEYLQREQLELVNPQLSEQFQHAIYFPEIANVRNPRLLQSLRNYLEQHPKVQFFDQTPIHKFQIQQDKVQCVETETGQKVYADQFVLTTGAWSGLWSEQLGLEFPVRPVQGQMALIKAPAHWLPTMCMNRVMYLIPRMDGHIVCGSSMQECGFNAETSDQIQQNILAAAYEMVPELAQFPIVQNWAGLRPSSPEGIPYIGQLPHLSNVWVNLGHFRNGLCMGPASAQLLRQLMLKQPTSVNAATYSPKQLLKPKMVAS